MYVMHNRHLSISPELLGGRSAWRIRLGKIKGECCSLYCKDPIGLLNAELITKTQGRAVLFRGNHMKETRSILLVIYAES